MPNIPAQGDRTIGIDDGLTAYWIVPPSLHGPRGFGVTAWSFDDAVQIIRALGYGGYLPDDLNTLTVKKGITVAKLDQPHVVANIGPIVVMGMWYPFVAIGVPAWAEERLARRAELNKGSI
jgi:hypothetical protein